MRAQVKPGGIFGRVANAFTSPTASPSASAPAPARGGGPPGDDGGGPAYGGGGYDDSPGQNDDDADDGSQANSPDTGYYAAEDSDPTEDLPDDFLDRDEPEEGDMGYLGEIDYHAALADLGDWKSDLANFGKTAAKDVARDALTQAGKSLTKGATPPPPPKVEPMGTGVKVAIGGGLALVGLVLVSKMMGGRSSSSERVAA